MTLLQIILGLFVLSLAAAVIGYRYTRHRPPRYRLVPFVVRVGGFAILGALTSFLLPSLALVVMGNPQGPIAGMFLTPLGLLAGAGFGYWWCMRSTGVA